jgi:hypothetical protein
MQLSFHKIPIRKYTINVESKVCNARSYRRLSNRCLPCSKEGELVSARHGECCPPRASEPRTALEPIRKDMHEFFTLRGMET